MLHQRATATSDIKSYYFEDILSIDQTSLAWMSFFWYHKITSKLKGDYMMYVWCWAKIFQNEVNIREDYITLLTMKCNRLGFSFFPSVSYFFYLILHLLFLRKAANQIQYIIHVQKKILTPMSIRDCSIYIRYLFQFIIFVIIFFHHAISLLIKCIT